MTLTRKKYVNLTKIVTVMLYYKVYAAVKKFYFNHLSRFKNPSTIILQIKFLKLKLTFDIILYAFRKNSFHFCSILPIFNY